MPSRPTRPAGLSHVEVNVRDLAASLAFWDWFLPRLGWAQFQDWPGGRSYRSAETYIVFVAAEERHAERPYHRGGPGLNHLAFSVETAGTVDTLREELRERGVPLLYEDRYPHAGGPDVHALFCEDPDRMKVEVVAGS